MKKKKTSKYLRGDELVALAEAAPKVLRARDFLPAVDKLREKGYSWRSCASWLEEHAGIKIDHAHLYRLSENRESLEAHEDEEL